MEAVGKSVVGMQRKNNQDAIWIAEEGFPVKNLLIVADGMGGHLAGEIASSTSIEAFRAYLLKQYADGAAEDEVLDALMGAIQYSNRAVFEKAQSCPECVGMGTTFIAAAAYNNKLYGVHVGDSRLYIFRNGSLLQVTRDHSFVMEMVKCGRITLEEAKYHPQKNIITRSLGTEEAVKADTVIEELSGGDMVLLCSDGLSNMVSEGVITEILIQESSLSEKVEALVTQANQNGGLDNISVILMKQEAGS